VPRIKIMDEGLANRIAAGEVVERPASVVKELVENSLDAGASSISVEIEGGGRRLIRVADNGTGMTRDDLLLCLERFATSKLLELSQLERIGTYGFRGEALPSIAAVSRLGLISRLHDELEGWMVRVEGGEVKKVEATGCAPGTLIEVRDLFFNTPARRKFLKTEQTEASHVLDSLMRLGLARPEIGLRVTRSGRKAFDLPPREDWAGRAAALLGRDLRDRLFPFSGQSGEVRVSGLFGPPDAARRGAGRALYLYVNGRPVRDRNLTHAVLTAYGELVPRGQYPVVVLRVDLPPEEVDVNVHPTKHEVRFRDGRGVHDAVLGALAAGLAPSPWLGGSALSGGVSYDTRTGEVQSEPDLVCERPAQYRPASSRASPSQVGAVRRPERRFQPGFEPGSPVSPARGPDGHGLATPEPPAEAGQFSSLRYIGQLGATYLLCQGSEGLVLLDQHAAHERVTYMRLLEQQEAGRGVQCQGLLVPLKLELSAAEAERAEELAARLTALGFEAEAFGGRTLVVKAVPALLAEAAVERLVRDVLDELVELPSGSDAAEKARDAVLARMACHGSTRAGYTMRPQEVRALLEAMDATERAGACPHGRPVMVEVPLREIEKWFHRT